jgi:Protein of unknown function (DUF1592)/Protein of unknown function (DUF1588)/Protein of unknown function (DUF1595)/Protein of unknown function (DUF1585)
LGVSTGASSGASGAGASGDIGPGSASGGAPGGPGPATVAFACNPAAKPPEGVLRRLTMTQYRNTLADLVSWAVGGSSAGQTVMSGISAPLAGLPDDRREAVPQDLHGSFRRLDQTLQQSHVDATYAVAVALGAALTTSTRLGTVVGACAADTSTSNDATCLDTFIRRFGARALRRPLASDEVDFYKMAYGTTTVASAAAYADLIGMFLTAPEFLYLVEHGDTAVAGQDGVFDVSTYELAARLSYQVWQTAPDDALLAAAADGSLRDAATYKNQVARLIADPRARPALDEFYADWMKVDDLPALDDKDQDPVFKTFAGADLPDPSLRQAMIDDVLGLLDYQTWTAPTGLAEIFTTDRSFARDARLAKIYGVAAWDGKAAPPMLPAGQRPGLLTRALFLSTGTSNTRPIMKGVFVRRTILCDEIPPPPAGANAKPPELGPGMTTRQSVEALTQVAGTTCAGCHSTIINPLGFATEGFDALGRYRTAQRLFDASGNEIGSKPVDVTGVPQVTAGDMTSIASPADLMTLMVGSGKVEACVARNFFRFTYGRWEDPAADGCALEDARQALAGGGKVTDLMAAVLMSKEFGRRTYQ